MIYSDFKWIKILLDMCFVIDDPIVCQIASKWNYDSIKSILHNIRYYPRKCEYNNVSKVNPYSMSRRISRLQDLAFFVEVSIFGNEQKPKSFIGWKMSDQSTPQKYFSKVEQLFKWRDKKSQNLKWKQWRKSFKIQSHYYFFLDPNYKVIKLEYSDA